MIKLSIMLTVALVLGMSLSANGAHAQKSMLQGPSTKVFLSCAKKCQKTFYFSEQSDPTFAGLRNACIEGCGSVVDANMSAYQSCNIGCRRCDAQAESVCGKQHRDLLGGGGPLHVCPE